MFFEQSDQSGECAPRTRDFMIAGFAEHFATGDFGNTRNRVETAREYRPGTPEVVLPCWWHMAWCAHHDCAARAASCCRSLATSMCRTHRRAREYVSDVGQRIAARSTAVVPASPGGGDGARAEHRTLVARSTCLRAGHTPAHPKGRRENWTSRRAVRVEVRVRAPGAACDTRGRRTIHGDPLSTIRRPVVLPGATSFRTSRFRRAAQTPAASAEVLTAGAGSSGRCRRQGGRVSMGVQEASPSLRCFGRKSNS